MSQPPRPRATKRHPVSTLAVARARVGLGGGYALAASKVKTITVCADKKTGVLHLKTHGKCKRGQTRVTWNQRGPQGPQGVAGAQGPAGQPGAPAVSVWAKRYERGSVRIRAGHLRAARLGRHLPGHDHRAGVCAGVQRAGDHRLGYESPGRAAPGRSPSRGTEAPAVNQQFMVFTGDVVRWVVQRRATTHSR